MPGRFRRPFILAVCASVLTVSALPTMAFDCTPLATLPNNGNMEMDYMGTGAVPGEFLCGFDYTGWDFHVYEFTIAGPTLQGFGLVTADDDPFSTFMPYAELLVLGDCDENACAFQWSNSSGGATSEPICLAPGTYTVIVATEGGTPDYIYGVATFSAAPCEPVTTQTDSWGTLKQLY